MAAITKAVARQISADIQKALEPVAEKYDMTVTMKGGKYDPTAGTYQPKVELAQEGADLVNFGRDARAFGLREDDYEAELTTPDGRYALVGFKLRAPKWPVIGRKLDGEDAGKLFKLRESVLEPLQDARRVTVK